MIQSLSPLEINQQGGSRVEVYHNPSTGNIPYELPGFERMQASGGYGIMDFFHYPGAGYDIWFSHYAMGEKSTFIARGDLSAIELHIPFCKQSISWTEGGNNRVLRDKQFDLSYFPFISSRTDFFEGQECSTFDIHYSAGYLQKYSAHFPALDWFLEKTGNGEQIHLFNNPQFLSPRMTNLVAGMLQYDMPPGIAFYYYESCVQLLLIEVLNRTADTQTPYKIKYSSHDIERAVAAKEIIENDLSRQYTIAELSRITAINEWKLRLTFKHIFGTTIFDYAQSARLEHAKHLLFSTADPIQWIATSCGYPDHSNFTAAFRKRFDYTPEEYRLSKK